MAVARPRAAMVTLVADPELSGQARALQLGLAVLNRGGTWDGNTLVAPANLVLAPDQQQLIVDHLHLVRLIVPGVCSPAICDRCGRFALQSGAAASAKCHVTIGCDGRLVGVSPAKAF